MRTAGATRKPPAPIHNPFAKATTASAPTKDGASAAATSTTSDSAASRSRNSHSRYVRKAAAVGRRFVRKYVMSEKRREIRTATR